MTIDGIRPAGMVCCLLMLLYGIVAPVATAQTAGDADAPAFAWYVITEDQGEVLFDHGHADSAEAIISRILNDFQVSGYYFASIDSVTEWEDRYSVHATAGPYVPVGDVQIAGLQSLDAAEVLARLQTRSGRLLASELLEEDIQFILERLERYGHPLAQLTLDSVSVYVDDGPRLRVHLTVDEGHRLTFQRIILEGGDRTSARFAERIIGLRAGDPILTYEPIEYRKRLEETGMFTEVGLPELSVDHNMNAVIYIPVEEESPGTFDLVLGYVPEATPGGKGAITGSGNIQIRNLFGSGRTLGLRLNRIPGQVSTIDVRASDPFVLGMPLRLEGRFHGHQQDSTFGNQRLRLEAGFRFAPGFETFVTVSREYTRPGVAGVDPGSARTPVPRADTWFAGIGIRYGRVDYSANPRRGLRIETNLEQGRRDRTYLGRMPDDPTRSRSVALRQQRLSAEGRLYVPTWPRQVFVVGGDARILISNEYDESDLFRVGGATSLRGYDEERFLGNAFGRFLVEYRYQVDRSSFAFLFSDFGFIDRPEMGTLQRETTFRPGYGLGVQYSTPIGLMMVSYAANPEDGPTDGRVHIGVSIGL